MSMIRTILLLCVTALTMILNAKEWEGSGFALNNGYIVTNNHVVEGADVIYIKGIKGDYSIKYKARVVVSDKSNDIAIIQIDDSKFKGFGVVPYSIKRGMTEVGSYVWTIGYPLTTIMGEEIKFTDGRISSKTGIQGDMSMYQISVPLQPGNSGGPLFDKNGYVIGITTAKLNSSAYNSENVNYAIKSSYLLNVIESTLGSNTMPTENTMQNASIEQKIKFAKNYVFAILCSDKIEEERDIPDDYIGWIHDPRKIREITKEHDLFIKYPSYLYPSSVRPKEIVVNSKYTIVILEWNNYKSKQTWVNVSTDTYLKCKNQNRIYKLVDTDQFTPKAPDVEEVPLNYWTDLILYFDPIDKRTSEIVVCDPQLGGFFALIQLY